MQFGSWTTVSVGVADMQNACQLWVNAMGLEIVAERAGPDADLADLWQLAADDITAQLLLATPGQHTGQLHLVEFAEPALPIRHNAEVFDWVAKNLDIYVNDMPARIAELQAAGFEFRNEDFSEVTAPNGVRFREIHLPAHDGVNVVLLEILGESQPLTDAGFGAVGPLITIVPDAARERAFFASLLGLHQLSSNVLDGPEIETMIGLPQGAALDVSIWGNPDNPMGEVEIIEYQGTQGSDLYARAIGKATGIRQIRYHQPDAGQVAAHLTQHAVAFEPAQ
ncbi:MAG: hypothetical protein AAF270_02945, partial [Pseudomonadota bacterium]